MPRGSVSASERLVVLVSERPHTARSHATAEDRLALARAAFPADDVRLDRHPRTVELLRAESFDDPVFVIGADQFRHFLAWSEPEEVLERTRLGGRDPARFSPRELDEVLESIERPERVTFFEIEPNPAASRTSAPASLRVSHSTGWSPPPSRGSSRSAGFTVREPGLHCRRKRSRTQQTLTPSNRPAASPLSLSEKLAEDVVILDMRPECSFTDYFVIATGRNPRQTASIWDEVHTRLKQDERLLPRSVDGMREGAGSSRTTSTSSSTSSRRTRASTTGSKICGATFPRSTSTPRRSS